MYETCCKKKPQQRANLENQLKELEKDLDEDNLSKSNSVKNELDVIYDHITEDMRIRSKCNWYEHGENSKHFFFNLEKQRGSQNTIKKLVVDDKEITNQTLISERIREFYETLFKKQKQDASKEMGIFFSDVDIPKLS